jgi:F0F1-type ATP synthase membrane subunit b/b'
MSELDLTGSSAYQALLAGAPLTEALPRNGDAYEPRRIEEAFEAFRRHIAALQSELSDLRTQAVRQRTEPARGEEARAETVSIVQKATELARLIEQDARDSAARQIAHLAEELAPRRRELHEREVAIERERVEILEAAHAEAEAQLEGAARRATEELSQAKGQAETILQQARREASELRAAALADAEQMQERARADAARMRRRAGAEPSSPAEKPARARRSEQEAPPEDERPETGPEPAPPAAEAPAPAPEPKKAERAEQFTAPPLSLEDLAARGVSRLRSEDELPER